MVPLIGRGKTRDEGTSIGEGGPSSLLDRLPLRQPVKYPTYTVGIKRYQEEKKIQ